MSDSSVNLSFNTHGKGRVRLVKVMKDSDGNNDVQQISVQILLQGYDMSSAFVDGVNENVVATDTCKNTIYVLASQHNFKSIEEFGILVCNHFLSEYKSIVNKVDIEISSDNWERIIDIPDTYGKLRPHKHCFQRTGPKRDFTHIVASKLNNKTFLVLESGFTGFDIMKTTQSGFEKFYKDRYTTLPDVTERLLGTSVKATWKYRNECTSKPDFNFVKTRKLIETNLVNAFCGPSDVGVYSPSVQKTLYEMGKAAIVSSNSIDHITLEMPNIHNIPFPLQNYGCKNEDPVTKKPYIFYPIDEPHGMIKATIERSFNKSRL